MTLVDLPRGSRARVRAVSAEAGTALRLREMGLRPGTLITLIGVAAAGARIVGLGAARIAIDAATARCIEADLA